VIGHGFTRNAFLAGYRYSFGVYVHSHADIYNSSSIQAAFLQDPPAGYCNSYTRDYISAAQVKANAIPPYNLVIMSTCYLGAMYQPHTGSGHPNYMPEAFGFTKTHGTTGSRFYVGYVYSTYDSAQYKFEGEMLRWLQLFPTDTLYSAWTYAAANSYSYPSASDPFQAAWFGDMNYRPKG
jgi:hypothetical protein